MLRWRWLALIFLAACARTPVEKPLVDLDSLKPPPPKTRAASHDPENEFRRLYAAPASRAEVPEWRERLVAARDADRQVLAAEKGGGEVYERKETRWTQTSFVQTVTMVHDRYLYDSGLRRYTVGRYLDDLVARFGGVDSVVLWAAYPNLGVDERTQGDLWRDLPGGTALLREAIGIFHKRGVRVLLAYHPWDDEEGSDPAAFEKLVGEVGADGVFDEGTVASGKARPRDGRIHEPEGGLGDAIESILWTPMAWADWRNYQSAPGVDRYKWLEPRFLNHVAEPGAFVNTDALQYAWLNGAGFLAWENLWGIWRQLSPRDAEALRRMALIYRALPDFPRSTGWEPYAPVLGPEDVFASKWPLPLSGAVWTFVNRGNQPVPDASIEVVNRAQRFYDLWSGRELKPEEAPIHNFKRATIVKFPLEAHGFGAILETNEPPVRGSSLHGLLPVMSARASRKLVDLPEDSSPAAQRLVEIAPSPKRATAPEGMVEVPAAKGWKFISLGTELEDFEGVDLQYPWETRPRVDHEAVRDVPRFFLDKVPVTNLEFRLFLRDRDYEPADRHNFLRDWPGGEMPAGLAQKAVTWVSIEDARAFCRAKGKRLPHEWEWQLAAQGTDGRPHPWGNEWDASRVPRPDVSRERRPGPDVGSFPRGASPYGALDMQGLVWQWTDEYFDRHTRAAVLKGGSYHLPPPSGRHFPSVAAEDEHPELRGRHQLTNHAKYLLMDESLDRAGTIGFRCAADATEAP